MREYEIEKIRDLILKHYKPVSVVDAGLIEGSMVVDSIWYAPIEGPDTLQKVISDLKDYFSITHKGGESGL